jgi:cell division septum initiation protein DivIVA
MSTSDVSVGSQKYYDTAEVEAYIAETGVAISQLQERLQDAIGRAEAAEQRPSGVAPDAASLGRALVLATEVADKTIAEADQRAAEIIQQAQRDAAGLVGAAREESERLVAAARQTAAESPSPGEPPLLAALDTFLGRSPQVREDLRLVEREAEACRWRLVQGSAGSADRVGDSRSVPPPPRVPQPEPPHYNWRSPQGARQEPPTPPV